MNRKLTPCIGQAVAKLLLPILGAFWALTSTANAQENASPAQFPIHADDVAFGDPSAPLDMIIYMSPTCQRCADFQLTQFERLQRDYVETGRLFLIVRTIVRTKWDLEYALISVCAAELGGAEGYVSAVEKLSTGVRKREGIYAAELQGPEKIKALLTEVYERPADREAMTACAESESPRITLQRNMADLGKLSDPFVPAFVIDDEQVVFGRYPGDPAADPNLYAVLDKKITICAEFTKKGTCR